MNENFWGVSGTDGISSKNGKKNRKVISAARVRRGSSRAEQQFLVVSRVHHIRFMDANQYETCEQPGESSSGVGNEGIHFACSSFYGVRLAIEYSFCIEVHSFEDFVCLAVFKKGDHDCFLRILS